jgi:hypothetical protein
MGGCCGGEFSVQDVPATPTPIVIQAIVQARRDICRDCEHATRNLDPKFAAFRGLTSMSFCKRAARNVARLTIDATAGCPVGRW